MFSGKEGEQDSKFDEIINILVAAGYFRARLTSLSRFDRIVGGMCWAITASAVDVDVDIVFQENSTIGQKIKISDQIVKSLRRMRCPCPLMSHQIQGSDFPALFPVCQWLVLKVIETRMNTGDIVRQFSVSQFNKELDLPQDLQKEEDAKLAVPFLNSVFQRYSPNRKYRRTNQNFKSRSARVHSVLLEYGATMKATIVEHEETKQSKRARPQSVRMSIGQDGEIKGSDGSVVGGVGGSGGSGGSSTGNMYDADINALAAKLGVSVANLDAESIAMLTQNLGNNTSVLIEKEESSFTDAERAAKNNAEQQLMSLQQSLEENRSDEGVIKASSVGVLVGLQSEQIKQAAEEAAAAGGSTAGPAAVALTQQQVFERQFAALERLIKVQQERYEESEKVHTAMVEEIGEVQKALEKKKNYNNRVVTETQKLQEAEKGKDQNDLTKLRYLISLNEKLKNQEAEFKENCKKQLQQLRVLMKEAEAGVSQQEEERMKQIEEMFEKDSVKFSKIRGAIGQKNQEIALLSRSIDEIPTRTELVQYERSFVELYDQVSGKLEETRRYYDQYNTLESRKNFLQREVQLLDSVSEWFKTPPSGSSKQKILQALDTYISSTKEMLTRATEKLQNEEQTRDVLRTKYDKLVEEQRKYFKAVKDFQDACTRNEQLLSQLQPKA